MVTVLAVVIGIMIGRYALRHHDKPPIFPSDLFHDSEELICNFTAADLPSGLLLLHGNGWLLVKEIIPLDNLADHPPFNLMILPHGDLTMCSTEPKNGINVGVLKFLSNSKVLLAAQKVKVTRGAKGRAIAAVDPRDNSSKGCCIIVATAKQEDYKS